MSAPSRVKGRARLAGLASYGEIVATFGLNGPLGGSKVETASSPYTGYVRNRPRDRLRPLRGRGRRRVAEMLNGLAANNKQVAGVSLKTRRLV